MFKIKKNKLYKDIYKHSILSEAFELFKMSYSTKELPELDLEYLCNPKNKIDIKQNIERRKLPGNIERVVELNEHLKICPPTERREIYNKLITAAAQIPNKSDPKIIELTDKPKIIRCAGSKKTFKFKPAPFEQLAKRLKLVRTEGISNFTGPRSYYLLDQLAKLEQALIEYSVHKLLKQSFELITVPDILPRDIIESCGMSTRGERNQVYSIGLDNPQDMCLSGTAEMGIASYLKNSTIAVSKLPLHLAAVSRCYRAETSKISEEKGIYRVHQFTKVEMFGVSTSKQSASLLEEFREIQEEMFSSLGLQLRVLDMPPEELGAQAYRKYDIEAYMPGKQMWGELSSASNCTDYQSRRLKIRTDDGEYAHTVNGTACAIPRMIIAIVETHQEKNQTVSVPEKLIDLMRTMRITQSRAPIPKQYYKKKKM